MKRKPVESSSIAALGYDPATMTLEVEFTSGRVYRYFDVPELAARRLMKAPSIGAHFGAEIRDTYHYERVR